MIANRILASAYKSLGPILFPPDTVSVLFGSSRSSLIVYSHGRICSRDESIIEINPGRAGSWPTACADLSHGQKSPGATRDPAYLHGPTCAGRMSSAASGANKRQRQRLETSNSGYSTSTFSRTKLGTFTGSFGNYATLLKNFISF